jgi:hypothetical protein
MFHPLTFHSETASQHHTLSAQTGLQSHPLRSGLTQLTERHPLTWVGARPYLPPTRILFGGLENTKMKFETCFPRHDKLLSGCYCSSATHSGRPSDCSPGTIPCRLNIASLVTGPTKAGGGFPLQNPSFGYQLTGQQMGWRTSLGEGHSVTVHQGRIAFPYLSYISKHTYARQTKNDTTILRVPSCS